MEPTQNNTRNTFTKIIAGIVVLGVAGFAFSRMDNLKTTESVPVVVDETPTSTEPISLPATSTEPGPAMSNNRVYKNGTYTADGVYSSPAGQESVSVTLTIRNDAVVSAVFLGKATNPSSIKNQEQFALGFKQYVIGKSVDSIKLTVVNGSSLTPKGFANALVKIKAKAKA